ncbi:COP23 domain-containing protein [Calothrix sp. 336/3]|uniref:COP23 domain-containing protein n=1 Tax=Calothrix sp. 336/3 TaxID=1337936 RepID=UPI0004E2FF31|nr:COP23 domain-containing protein [Calothrix sp. 336/3]AKG22119.1 hypothetical protein IJ00_13385 [Calothrix sp. 336/3]
MQLKLGQILSAAMTVAISSVVIVANVSNQPSYAGNQKFICRTENGVSVTKVYTPRRGYETFIRWVVKDFKKFPPSQRCKMVTARLQRYYDNGKVYITERNELNGYPVLCIANTKGSDCAKDNILVTLKPGTDTGKILRQIIAFRDRATGEPINLSGSNYATYVNGDVYIDIKQLVDADTSQSKPQLTPVEPRF